MAPCLLSSLWPYLCLVSTLGFVLVYLWIVTVVWHSAHKLLVQFQGALTGMIMSLIITSWVTIGTIASNLRPTPLPLRHDGCPLRNTSIFNSSYDITTLSDMTSAYVTTEFLTTSDLNLMTTKAPDDGLLDFVVLLIKVCISCI